MWKYENKILKSTDIGYKRITKVSAVMSTFKKKEILLIISKLFLI